MLGHQKHAHVGRIPKKSLQGSIHAQFYIRVANITDFSLEIRNSKNDPHFSRFLYGVSKFSDFLRILQFFYFFQLFYRNWESSQASTMEFMDC